MAPSPSPTTTPMGRKRIEEGGGAGGGAVLPFLFFLPQPQHNVCLSQAVGVSFLGNRVTSHKDRIPLLGRARMGWETPLIPSFSAPSFSFA